jgi:predicted Rossmann fold flavoprotein
VSAESDVLVVGGGAAGLATAIFAARASPGLRIVVLDGARAPGAKILVSGGSRCNVTNREVTERDFNGGPPAIVRRVLRAFPAARTVEWFTSLGVPLHEEAGGKLFPDSNRSRDVLNVLLRELARASVPLLADHRVLSIEPRGGHFAIGTSRGPFTARAVVLASGGLALPKTGSDGAGYGFAQALGHSIVPTTPALVPLILEGGGPFWKDLSGVSAPARVTVSAGGSRHQATGALLWTHFGISGPAVLDASRHWLRGRLDAGDPVFDVSFAPGEQFDAIEARWLEAARAAPRSTVQHLLSGLLPASLSPVLLRQAGVDPGITLATCARAERRRAIHQLLAWRLPILDSRGYTYAEVTAGGVALSKIDPATMQSRLCPRLFLVGEILDVDGRLGGFNFQWAWSSGFVAGQALGRIQNAQGE